MKIELLDQKIRKMSSGRVWIEHASSIEDVSVQSDVPRYTKADYIVISCGSSADAICDDQLREIQNELDKREQIKYLVLDNYQKKMGFLRLNVSPNLKELAFLAKFEGDGLVAYDQEMRFVLSLDFEKDTQTFELVIEKAGYSIH